MGVYKSMGYEVFHLRKMEYAEYYRSIRKHGFCTYVISLTNQINAVIHSRISDSIGHTWPSCVGDDLHAERVGEQSQSLQVQGVIQTSLRLV